MLIKNYGHLWERKFINLGDQKLKGHLRGYNGNISVDFREQIGVYALYDRNIVPVYVGQAGSRSANLFNRLKQHDNDHLRSRWELFSWFGFRSVTPKGKLSARNEIEKPMNLSVSYLLNEFEAILMTAVEPRFNKQGARWKEIDEYRQEIDLYMEEVTLYEINDKIEELMK